MSQVLAICPSRDRPEACAEMVKSFLETSADPTAIAIWVDGDQRALYEEPLNALGADWFAIDRGKLINERRRHGRPRVMGLVGERCGSVSAANQMVHYFRDPFTIYGMIPDDSKFLTGGWDAYLRSHLSGPAPAVVAAHHNGGDYVNFPWVNRAWVEAVGWYYYPKNFHHCCDTIVEILGECSQSITYASSHEFAMHHDHIPTLNREKLEKDLEGFLFWCVGERRDLVKKLRAAIAVPQEV